MYHFSLQDIWKHICFISETLNQASLDLAAKWYKSD